MPLPRALPSVARRIAVACAFMAGLGRPAAAQQPAYTPYAVATLAGAVGSTGGTDGSGGSARFSEPSGIAVDGSGNLYVADSGNHMIRKVTPGGVVTTLAGSAGVPGSADGTGAAARFNEPIGIAVDGSGNLYVADSGNHTIRKVTPGGVVTTVAGTAGHQGSADGHGGAAQFNYPWGVAVDGSGNLYVADTGNETIRLITPGGDVTTLAGTVGPPGSADGTGGSALFNDPRGIAVDGKGNLYVADCFNCTIRMIAPGGVVTTVAGNPGTIIAGGGFGVQGSADGPVATARFGDPEGVAVDASGAVYVADSGNNTIRRVAGGMVTTLAGIHGLSGAADGTGPAAQFWGPEGIAADAAGNVYVVDSFNSTVRTGRPGGPQKQATVILGGLYQNYDGTPKSATVTTVPAGLSTLIVYDNAGAPGIRGFAAPYALGSYPVYAVIADPAYSGSASGTITIGPGLSAQVSFTVQNSLSGGSFLRGIAAGPAGLVAVGDAGAILTSSDGFSWVSRTSGTMSPLEAVAYGAGQFVAVGDSGCVLLSTDGVSWASAAQSATTARLNNVIYAAGQYVAVGDAGTIISSADGRSWTARSSGVTGWLRGLTHTKEIDNTWNDGSWGLLKSTIPARFAAAGQGGAVIVSTDGITWGRRPEPFAFDQSTGKDIESLAANSSSYLEAVCSDGSVLTESVNLGSEPAIQYAVFSDSGVPSALPGLQFSAIVQGPSAPFVAGANGSIETQPFSVGPWMGIPAGTSASLAGGVFVGDSLFVVGENETILRSAQRPDSRLVNLSCRAKVGTGANILIAGFVVGGQGASGTERVLVRGSGPALVPFGVPGTLPDPELQLFSTAAGSSLEFQPNTGWLGNQAVSAEAYLVGAFPWTDPSSHDAALVGDLAPGPYTANISGESGDTGVALAEVYDGTPEANATAASPRLINISARSQAGSGAGSLIAGFVIGGSTPKTVLIRASGPALAAFGVLATLPDPELQVYSTASGSTLIGSNTGWGGDAQIATAAAWAGAFSWGGSATPDSALLLTLPPGPYTANVTGASGDTGTALVEVYELQ